MLYGTTFEECCRLYSEVRERCKEFAHSVSEAWKDKDNAHLQFILIVIFHSPREVSYNLLIPLLLE